jgi:hypothetical protein
MMQWSALPRLLWSCVQMDEGWINTNPIGRERTPGAHDSAVDAPDVGCHRSVVQWVARDQLDFWRWAGGTEGVGRKSRPGVAATPGVIMANRLDCCGEGQCSGLRHRRE